MPSFHERGNHLRNPDLEGPRSYNPVFCNITFIMRNYPLLNYKPRSKAAGKLVRVQYRPRTHRFSGPQCRTLKRPTLV